MRLRGLYIPDMEFTIAAWIFIAVFSGVTIVSVVEERQKADIASRFSRYLSFHEGPRKERINTTFQQRIIQPVLDKMQAVISTRISDTMNQKIRQRILNAGYPLRMTAEEFLIKNICVVLLATGGVAGCCFLYFHLDAGRGLYMTFMGAFVFGVAAKYALEARITKRKAAIERELPEILDYLQVGVQAGLSIDNAIDRIVGESSNKQIMAYEFKIYLHDIKMGLPRAQALQQLYYRTQSKSVKNFSDGIIQSVKTGMALGDVLQVIRRDIYDAIRTEAEKRAVKAPVVMMIPLILFIFPTVFLITVGPTILIMIQEMKKF